MLVQLLRSSSRSPRAGAGAATAAWGTSVPRNLRPACRSRRDSRSNSSFSASADAGRPGRGPARRAAMPRARPARAVGRRARRACRPAPRAPWASFVVDVWTILQDALEAARPSRRRSPGPRAASRCRRRSACRRRVRNIDSGQPPRCPRTLQGGHVDVVDVRPLLAVDLDADEVLVEDLRHFLVVERLALHDVAPVARAVADGEEDELAFLLRLGERLVAPGIPVDRVVGVLEQIGAALAGQAVGVLGLLLLRSCLETGGQKEQEEGPRRAAQAVRRVSWQVDPGCEIKIGARLTCRAAVRCVGRRSQGTLTLMVEGSRQLVSSQACTLMLTSSGLVSPLARSRGALIVTLPS